MLPRILVAAFVAAGLSGSATGYAADAPGKRRPARYYFRLDYRIAVGLHGCPSEREVRDVLSGNLDYDAIRDDDGPGLLMLDLSRKGGKIQASIALDGAGEHWEATIAKADTCHEVVLDALVNLDAAVSDLILSPLQKKAEAAEPKAPVPPPAPTPVELPPAPVVPPPAPVSPPPRPLYQAGIASVFSAGTAPVVTGGVGWMLGVRWPEVSAAFEGRVTFAPSAEIDGYRKRDTYNFVFAAASVSVCVHPWAAWAFACARGEIGTLSFGLNNSPDYFITSNRVAFLGAGFRLGGEHVLMRGLALRVYAEVLAEPVSGSLALDDKEVFSVLWPGSVVSGSIGIGPVISF